LSGVDSKSQKPAAPLVALLALGHCLAFIDRNLPAVAAPLLKTDLGLSDTQLGLLDGPAFALLYVVGMLVSWPLARSRHRFRVLALCIATWAAGMAIFAFGHAFIVLVLARAMVGLGQAAYVPIALNLIVESSVPQWRARSIATFTAAAPIGRGLSLLLGGVVLAMFARWMPGAAFAHWRLLFLVMAAPNLLLIGMLWSRKQLSHEVLPPFGQVFRQMQAAFRERPGMMGAYFCGAGASVLVVQTIGAWAPSILHREQGLTPAMAALVFGICLLMAQPLGHFTAGALIDRRKRAMPPTTIVAWALLLVIPLLCLVPSASSASMACCLLALASLASGVAALAALAGLPLMLGTSLHDAGFRIYLSFITLTGVALGPFMAGRVSDGLGMGGHGLSLALCEVCVVAAIAGTLAAFSAGRNGYRVAMERAG
jgi:predicted MFS family arabinose efflux permease